MPRFLFLLILTLSAWAQTPPSTDAQIDAQLRDRLARSVIGKDGFTVQVKAGVVYWSGTTTVAQHKGAATRMAKSSGARRVVNTIRVQKGAKKPAATKATATAVPAGPSAAPTALPPPPPPPPLARATVKWRETRP